MISIFNYIDYRAFLADYYNAQKKVNPRFSYQFFANKIGFKDKGFIYRVIKGEKNLSQKSLVQLSNSLGLTKSESNYFSNLVSFNQAKTLDERNYFHTRLESMKSTNGRYTQLQLLRKDQYSYFSKWFNLVIRSLIDMYGFRDDYTWLAKTVFPPITIKQAKQSVGLLEKLGLIKKQKNGTYQTVDKSVDTGKEVLSLAVLNFHQEMMRLAARAVNELPKTKRNVTGMTMGISEKTYKLICDEIQDFQLKLSKLIEEDKTADRVFQLNFHFFPLSSHKPKKGDDNA